ncbi:S49 family peptidase [Rhodosalinus sp. FB01]|uniref:S49 family peptidase n=1 Tax=Rhodosalinus sp. FB01 TaxID=3239194 RepID=UPI00352634DA
MEIHLPFLSRRPTVAVVRLTGMIGTGGRSSLNDNAVAPAIERAFSRGKPAAVALEINSPGGAPTQSSLIGARIRRLADEKKIPVYAFVEDVAASGGYWIACAADEIWADTGSVVGSIGVISASFGAHVFLARQGLERRVHTAGNSKTLLDPFEPEKPEDVERLRRILDQMHGAFIGHVKSRRGDRLADDPDIYTGEIWLGAAAQEKGLVDGIGHLEPKMQEIFGDKVRFRRYGLRRGILQRLGAQVLSDGIAVLEERAAYARLGLWP